MNDLVPLLEAIAPVYIPTIPRDKRARLEAGVKLPAISCRQVGDASGDLQVNCWAGCPADAIRLAREVAGTIGVQGGWERTDQVDLERESNDRTEGLVHCSLKFRAI